MDVHKVYKQAPISQPETLSEGFWMLGGHSLGGGRQHELQRDNAVPTMKNESGEGDSIQPAAVDHLLGVGPMPGSGGTRVSQELNQI